MKQTTREALRQAKKKKEERQRLLVYIGLAVAVVAVAAVIIVLLQRSPNSLTIMGDAVTIGSTEHVPSDTVPGPYNSNPPAGGNHFDEDYQAGFFEESDLADLAPHPEGYLVHSLEHGYVIFWYNCQVAGTDCTALKQTIRDVMDETGNTKLIAFPWADMEVPLAMTSWGRILKFTSPDKDTMAQFVLSNRYKAPEPDAP